MPGPDFIHYNGQPIDVDGLPPALGLEVREVHYGGIMDVAGMCTMHPVEEERQHTCFDACFCGEHGHDLDPDSDGDPTVPWGEALFDDPEFL